MRQRMHVCVATTLVVYTSLSCEIFLTMLQRVVGGLPQEQKKVCV